MEAAMDYARAIRTVRVHRGLSQQELATQMGVDEAFLSLGWGRGIPLLVVRHLRRSQVR